MPESPIPTEEPVELLVALIQNACINDGTPDSGNEAKSVATLAGYFGSDGEVVEPRPGRQSVVYRVPGREQEAARLLLIPHLDVVPANPAEWTHDPFGGERADGFVWGRGAVDMLNVTAAMAAVFKRYLTGELPPLPGDLIYCGVADEEAGGELGAKYLADQRWDLVGCDYLLTEVAAPPFPTADGPLVPVTAAEKGPAWRRLTARGVPGHGSQPYGAENALLPLTEAMNLLGTSSMPVAITDEWRGFIAGLPLDPELAGRLVDPDEVDGAIDTLAADDPIFARWAHACTHLTVTPTMLESGVKANVIPEAGEGNVDVRLLPGQEPSDIDDHFRKTLGASLYDRLTIEPVMEDVANSSTAMGSLWEAIGDGVETMTGRRALVPSLTPVSTDARFFRQRGIPSYGVGLFDDQVSFGDMLAMFHGTDERVSEASVGLTTNLLAEVLAAFGRRTGT